MNLWIKLHLKSAYIFLSFCTQIHHHLIRIFCDIQSHQCQGNTGTDYSGITQCLSFFHRDKNPWRKKKIKGERILVGFQYQLATAHHGGEKHCSRNTRQSRAERTGSVPRLPRLYIYRPASSDTLPPARLHLLKVP